MAESDRAVLKRLWLAMLSWGLAVLVITVGLTYWVWSNQREQNQAMCSMMETFTTGPPPVPGPAGDRSRKIAAAMAAYQVVLGCGE